MKDITIDSVQPNVIEPNVNVNREFFRRNWKLIIAVVAILLIALAPTPTTLTVGIEHREFLLSEIREIAETQEQEGKSGVESLLEKKAQARDLKVQGK